MTSDPPAPPRPFRPWSLAWAALFAVAHTQAPEYYSNQHQYYLHGLAMAGVGHLDEDWLANTRDPTPVFSALVAILYKGFGPFGLHAAYFVLLGVYFESMRRLVEALPGFPDRGPARVLFLTLFLAVHAAIVRAAAVGLTGIDYPWYLQTGLANQYILGPGLQPSAFGVLLVTSLAAFARGRPVAAAALAAAVAIVHSTYLLPAGLIVLGYVVVLWREGRMARGLLAGFVALGPVLPVVAYNLWAFGSAASDEAPEARRILAEVRIPHHAVIGRWLDAVAVVQLALMLAALVLVRRSRLFPVLALAAAGALALTVAQAWTGSHALALLFPWRLSAVLMPVATAVLLAKLAGSLVSREAATPVLVAACGLLALGLAAGGVYVMGRGLGYQGNEAEKPLLDHIREHKRPGDVYLLPVKFPTLKKESPAGQSKTFVPPVRAGQVGIPVDLQRFRLYTGAPIYVDFKAVPYAPAEVLEWHTRMADVEKWYGQRDWDATGVAAEVAAAGVTHVVATADRDVTSDRLELVYADESYRLYRVRKD